jgi:hypothetical protein
MLALAWILAIVGVIVAYIISLAGAMSTVPQLHWQDAVVGIPLPLSAGVLAAWCLVRPIRRAQAASTRPWIAAGVPFVLAVLALLFMAVSYFDQPGGPM